ncbi:MAG: hypothetical protein DRQ46_01610 [Gammaproteobacteria bacterium]|nr:MAG: hypothetical protein DRQ46_01610 [Gammaproteobacteria bacterium]
MLKPSFKSIEGQSVLAIVLGGLVMLYELLAGDGGNNVPIDAIIEHAKNATEIAQAYKLDNIGNGWDTAKVTVILAFIYKIYGRFTDSRTSLKKKELEVGDVAKTNTVG